MDDLLQRAKQQPMAGPLVRELIEALEARNAALQECKFALSSAETFIIGLLVEKGRTPKQIESHDMVKRPRETIATIERLMG